MSAEWSPGPEGAADRRQLDAGGRAGRVSPRTSRPHRSTLGVAALGLLLAGCGSDEAAEPGSDADAAPDAPELTDVADAADAADAAEAGGGLDAADGDAASGAPDGDMADADGAAAPTLTLCSAAPVGACPTGMVCERLPGGFGVCLPRSCETDADCRAGIPGPGRACCVPFQDVHPVSGDTANQGRACVLDPYGACGPDVHEVGERCLGDVACEPGVARCARNGLRAWRCVRSCGSEVGCPEGLACEDQDGIRREADEVVAGTGQCRPPPDEEASLGDSCAVGGEGACPPNSECRALGRFGAPSRAVCLRTCTSDDDCPSEMWCPKQVTSFGGWCLPEAGSVPRGGSCAHDPLACEDGLVCTMAGSARATCVPPCGDCPEGWTCPQKGFSARPGHTGSFAGCVPEDGAPVGTSCAHDPVGVCGPKDCWPPWGDGVCNVRCASPDEPGSCPEGWSCEDPQAYSRCRGGEARAVGEPCRDDPGRRCGPDLRCDRAAGTARCRRLCGESAETICPEGTWCDGRLCLPAGDGERGAPCPDGAGDCAAGLVCAARWPDGTPRCRRPCTPSSPDCASGRICHPYPGEHLAGACAAPGEATHGQSCAGAPLTCAEGHRCVGPADAASCLQSCSGPGDCPDGSRCAAMPGTDRGLVCRPTGSKAAGETCLDAVWSCAESLHCVGTHRLGAEQHGWARCLEPCGTPHGGCGQGAACLHVSAGRAYCVPTGERGPGEPCTDAPLSCGSGTLCVPGGDEARCLRPCLPGVECPDGTSCRAGTAAGQPYCVPEGFEPADGLTPPW